jgi:hypothetical protein
MWSSKPTKIGRILVRFRTLAKTIPRVSGVLVTDVQTYSYIAGFLDGDGCINLQLVRRKDYVLGYQIRASVTFFQRTVHRSFLEWIQSILGAGFIRERKDGVAEYSITESRMVLNVLSNLTPYVRLKKMQCNLVMSVLEEMLSSKRLEPAHFLRLARQVDRFGELNVSKRRSIRSDQVEAYLRSRQLLIP